MNGYLAARAIHAQPGKPTDTWLTPKYITDALGGFNLDPCAAPPPRPWPTAARHIARPDDGLAASWSGRVWLNPPYSAVRPWMARMAAHGRGTALVFARVETGWFRDYVWEAAAALLFLDRRVSFVDPRQRGNREGHNATAPSVLAAYGAADAGLLASCGLPGVLTRSWDVRRAPQPDPVPVLFGQPP